MIRRLYDRLSRILAVLCALFAVLSFAPAASASPFGQGVFGADVPFGSLTSLTIALDGDIALDLLPDGSNFSGSDSHTVTVTSTDVVGYNLYVYSPDGTDMVAGSGTIPASSNSVAGPLATNTWGYNTDASEDYLGMATTPALLKQALGPYKNGDDTTVTYGVLAGGSKSADSYAVSVTYTAAALNY